MKHTLFFGLIAFLVLAGALYFIGVSTRDRVLADADHELDARAQFFADQLDRVLQQRMVQTFTFAALPSVRGFAASDETGRTARTAIALAELQSIVSADPNVRVAAIVDSTGRIGLATSSTLMNVDWSNRLFVRDALAGKISASVPAREYNEVSQFYAAPILDNAGQVAGSLVLRVAIQELWAALGTQMDVLLVDESGVRIADRSTQPQMFVALASLTPDVTVRLLVERRYGAEITQINTTNLLDLSAAVKRGEAMRVVYRDASNQTLRAATRRLKINPWTVIVFSPEDAILAPVREMIIDQIKIAVIVATLMAGTIYVAWASLGPGGNRV